MGRIYCCQFDIVWEDKKANYSKVKALLSRQSIPRDSLVLLPEMFSTGFSMNVAGIVEDHPSETETFLSNTARELGIYLVGGVVSRANEQKGRNEAVAFPPDGRLLARYAKMQPFTLGGEAQHYAAGTETIVFNWDDFLVAPLVCYDLRFPELFRRAVQRQAQLFAVIANWPIVRIQHWVTLLQARAIENQAYVAGVNRCGADPKLKYNGRSLIIDPHGEILADAGETEAIISAEVDVQKVLSWRADFPALKDMRTS